MIGHYDWAGGREAMLRFGPADGPAVIAALPLFEEANRTRHFMVTILRLLAERGIGGMLPDLPGAAESLIPTAEATLADWRSAFASAAASAGRPVWSIAFRGGALIDDAAQTNGRWHLAPAEGASLLKDLRRADAMTTGGDGSLMAGNRLGMTMIAELESAVPRAGRVARLTDDHRDADVRLAGNPLWRRAEPGEDDALAAACAEDIAGWIATCGG